MKPRFRIKWIFEDTFLGPKWVNHTLIPLNAEAKHLWSMKGKIDGSVTRLYV